MNTAKEDFKIIKEETRSICPVCYTELRAQIIKRDNRVFMLKECPQHGQFDILIEKDAVIYEQLANKEYLVERVPFANLAVSVTHNCDLSCNICCLTQRDNFNFPIEDIKIIISGMKNKLIWLTGGEPTLRKDLPEIIEYIVKSGNEPILITNGSSLADFNYVNRLKNAGLKRIHFSFNGLSDKVYEKINGQRLLKIKLKALRNIKRAKIKIIISMLLVRGVNENELERVLKFCLKNSSFIHQLRVRSSVQMGRHAQVENFCLSELVKIFTKILRLNRQDLINHSLESGMHQSVYNIHHMPCHLEIDLSSLLINKMEERLSANFLLKRFWLLHRLYSLIGLKDLIKIIVLKAAGQERLLDFSIRIRVWPDKYTIDLAEIQRCPTACLTAAGNEILPFCYALVLNDRNYIL